MSPYTAGVYLAAVGGRLISNKCAFRWPPYSPDLNPLDYWFWPYTKMQIQKHEISSLEDLKLLIPLVISEIPAEMIKNAISDFKLRILALKELKGGHFEQTLDEFKRRYRRSQGQEDVCDYCNAVHICPCRLCKISCLSDRIREREIELEDASSDEESEE